MRSDLSGLSYQLVNICPSRHPFPHPHTVPPGLLILARRVPAARAVKPAQYQRSIPRQLGLDVRVNNCPFNPPAVEGQVYGDALVFALEHS
jgi:hypothetical protein